MALFACRNFTGKLYRGTEMKFAMQLDYATFLIMDQATFNKLTEVISRSEIRSQEGYGGDARYTPKNETPRIIVLREDQLVNELPVVEPAE